ELDRLPGHALRHFKHGGILQIATRDRPDDAGHHARFEIVVQDVARRDARPPGPSRYWLRVAIEPPHVSRRIVGPALAADVGVEMCIAVSDDIEPGYFLLVQID